MDESDLSAFVKPDRSFFSTQNTPSRDGVFCLSQIQLSCGWSLHPAQWYTEGERGEDQMLNDLFFIVTILMTRVLLPITLTLIAGSLLHRALHRQTVGA